MESKAAVIYEPVGSDDFSESRPAAIETIDVADPSGEEVLVEIAAGSLCHTDIAIALGNLDEPYPMVMGHEGAGIVREVGEDVDSVQPGDHVVLGRIACGQCQYCRMGRSNLCEERTRARQNGTLRTGDIRFSKDGNSLYHCHGVTSFSEYTVVTEEVAIPITDEVPLEQATLLGCGVFTGVGAVTNTADIEAGSSVVIFGAGGVGLSAVQGARLHSAGEIVAVDLVPEKLGIAKSLGATHTVDASQGDPVERVREILPNGADYAFDIVGIPQTTEQCVDVLATTGTAVIVGASSAGKKSINLDMVDVTLGEKEIIGSFNGSFSLQLAIPTLAEFVADGRLKLEPLISATRPLSELNDAMDDLEHGTMRRQVILPP